MYELVFDDGDSGRRRRRSEALSCASVAELVPKVQAMMRERRLTSIEVRWFGKPLFTLKA
jgi:hypothetical protein